MHRAAVLLAAAVLVLAPRAEAKEPLFLLKAKPAKDKVALGEKISIDLTLYSASTRVASCGKLELGSPSGVVFYVKVGTESPRQVLRLMGKYQGNDFKETVAGRDELKGGKNITGHIDLLAIKTGKWEITPVYLGVEKAVWPDPIEGKPFTVQVGPGPQGETKIGARIKTGKGVMTMELLPEKAFNTVHNYLSLAGSGFYSNRIFHRIMKDFMVQTGDPNGNGTGGPGWCVPAEFNDVKHEKGVLSMARENHPNTAGSQFFVMTAKNDGLDGRYTAFGRLVDGMPVLDALANVPVQKAAGGEASDPIEKPKLEGVEMVLLK
jgi:cyclophilin family peptidyl-prolyl cis-trans isomerase